LLHRLFPGSTEPTTANIISKRTKTQYGNYKKTKTHYGNSKRLSKIQRKYTKAHDDQKKVDH